MKQKLLNKLWLRVGMIVAIMTTALSGTAWADAVTVSMTSFSEINGNVDGDANISYAAAKGTAATPPAVNNNEIRVYQNGGTFTVTANNGVKINSITLGSSMATTVTYSVDGGTASSNQSITANGTVTVGSLNCSSVLFTCTGTTKTSRLYVNSLSVTYTSGGTPTPTTYTVTYNANGATSGDVPTDNNSYSANASVTVLGNTGSLAKTDYTFAGWNTAADGTGTDYAEGATFNISANTILYAQWEKQASESGNVAVTLTQSNLGLTGSYTTNTEKTIDGITYVFTDLMKSNENIQAKASSGTIKNTTAYSGYITSVAITHSGTARPTTINGSADGENWTQVATGSGSITADFAGKGYKYFQITRGSNAAYWEKIEITYSTSSNPVCAMPTFNPTEGTYTSAQNVTISTATEGATIYYTTDGTDPTTSSTQYSGAIPVNNPTTIKAIAVADGYDNSSVASATYTIVPLEHAGTQADPYTVADAFTAIDADAGITGVYATGVVSEIVTAYSSDYGNITFDIIDEGGSNTLRAYRCTGTDAADVQVGDVVVVSGDLTKYGEIYEFTQGCQLVSLEHPTTPNIVVAETTIEVSAEGVADGSIEVTYNNFTDVLADVAFYEEDGETPATYDWITASINEDNNNLDYFIEENKSTESRTAYLKVYALDDEANDVYSELITINQAGIVVDYAKLPFNYDGNGTGTLPAGLTVSGLGTYNSSPKMQFNGTGDYLILKINEVPGKLSFDIKGNSFSGGTFNVQTSADGKEYRTIGTYKGLASTVTTEMTSNLDADVRYIKWIYTEKVNGNVALGNIILTKEREVTVGSAGYATYCSRAALDFTDSHIKAYVGTRSGDKLTFTPITQVPANTGLLLVYEGGKTEDVPVLVSAPAVDNNCLVGVTTETTITSDDYILNVNDGKAGFYKAYTYTTIAKNRAYIPASVGAGVKGFAIDLEDDATGIETLSDSPLKGEEIYNLAGQRLSKAQKGVNIVNGKKVMVK